jgi:hypothetical protein
MRQGGNLYEIDDSPLVRIVDRLLHADVYRLERLRCNTCGDVFTAEAPEGVGSEKYDATSTAMVALMKYGSGFPFHRLERLEDNLGIPLPASTQWEMVRDGAQLMQPVFAEHIRQAASGEVLFNDDTSVKISSRSRPCREDPKLPGGPGSRPASFHTGRAARSRCSFRPQTRRRNLADVLAERRANYPPIQMCDALPRSSGELEVILANCSRTRDTSSKQRRAFQTNAATSWNCWARFNNDAITANRSLTSGRAAEVPPTKAPADG